MEDDLQNKSKKNTIIMIAAVIIIVAIVVGGAVYSKVLKTDKTVIDASTDSETSATAEESKMVAYKDGEYSAEGVYSYHSGTESIGVNLTLKDGIVENVSVEEMAESPTSKAMQEDFAANYKTEVVGKNIDDINLGKISGSSLTPKGFNDAIEKIKTQAQS